MKLNGRLISLHKHWLVADSVSYHLRRSLSAPADESHGMADKFAAMSVKCSELLTISVYYSLLYVVIEGYTENKLQDDGVDAVLSKNEYVDSLRHFRNKTFHYQTASIPQKIMEFLEQKDSELWISDLNRAFRVFFEKSLDLKSVVAQFQETSSSF